jgi:excisionase family DNA binding protein
MPAETKVKLLTVEQAAEALGVAPATIRMWIWRRRIPYAKISRAVRISSRTIEEIIERGTVPALSLDGRRKVAGPTL